MLDFIEKPLYSKNRNANAGVFFMKSDFIKFVKSLKKPVFDFSNDIIPYFKKKIFCIKTNKLYYDIGTIQNYKLVNSILQKEQL